ncbi:VTC domain-containing [Micractinium conductrix]|uniref:VTC domain-containing n=1 Tax=Micractinium conductrix TaxID=554055 RepID=A0A2P6VCB6_9CHLO|nr:VTC domain-containing [Micractinium conductrix]|eukprot:PSC71737.1 VTC domain-containing [Micractinium conductrix]
MKFGKYLVEKQRPAWAEQYVDYKALKDLIKASAVEEATAGVQSFSPRTTSLTVQRSADRRDSAEERFFQTLEGEVEKCGAFTARLVGELRERLKQLQGRVRGGTVPDDAQRAALLEEAKAIGDEFLQLEKYVNLNYMGFHKILKKHDKMLPHSPCRQFYISHLHNQPWVQGNYSDLLVILSAVYSDLRGDRGPMPQGDDAFAEGTIRSTTKYWVRMSDVSTVKHHILQHLPVSQVGKQSGDYAGDAQLVNSVYLDNSSLELYHGRLDKRPNAIAVRIRWYGPDEPSDVVVERKTHKETWKGDESVHERFDLREEQVLMYMDGDLPEEAIQQDMRHAGRSEEEVETVGALFSDVQRTIDAKQLKPMVRTQYMRTEYQIPFDGTVRIGLDTNICMIKENPEEGPTTASAGRWYRDPSLPVHRTEITRFPHACLEIKLALGEGDAPPDWVAELVDSGLLTEVHKFSKFIHGTATLFPDMVQAVPYWVDDESVRASMLMSAPEPSVVAPSALDQHEAIRKKPRKRFGDGGSFREEEDSEAGVAGSEIEELRQPLLRRDTSLMSRARKVGPQPGKPRPKPLGPRLSRLGRAIDWWFSKPPMQPRPSASLASGAPVKKIEPKTFFANERTFLSWLHMAVTIGSIATALLGFSGSSKADPGGGRDLVEFIACILLPVAILMCGYALLVFIWRGGQILDKSATLYDDRRGPLGLAAVIVCALSLIFMVAFADLISLIRHHGDAPPAPAPPPPAALQLGGGAAATADAAAAAVGAAARSLLGA